MHWMTGCVGTSAASQPAGATALYQTVITLTLSFLVFTFGQLLVAIQIAGGQLTPRIIATILLRNNVVRYSVGLFVFTLVFAVGALNRQEEAVHELVATVTATIGNCVHRRLPVPDRLRRASAAAGRRRCPRRRRGHGHDRGRLSGAGDRATAGGSCAPRQAGHAQPRGRAPRNIRNRARGRHPHAGGAGAAPRRHDRVSAAGRGFRCRRRAVVRAPWRRDGDRRPHRAARRWPSVPNEHSSRTRCSRSASSSTSH